MAQSIVFYKDPVNRLIDPTLFSEKAETLAKTVAASGKGNRDRLQKNKRSQIRKFYDELLRLQDIAANESWDNAHPFVNMLTAKAAYALGRDYITNDFLKFIKESIDQVNTKEDLDVFASLFEAFMGFYKLHGE